MRTLTLALLALPLLLTACDSGDADDVAFAGRYTAGQTVPFRSGPTPIDIRFDIQLDLDEPGADGAFTGTVVFERGAVGNAAAITARGTVDGERTGDRVVLSASGFDFGKHAGDGLRLSATGTLDGATITAPAATILDFAYGVSETFELTLRR